jgi:hypothetical protein
LLINYGKKGVCGSFKGFEYEYYQILSGQFIGFASIGASDYLKENHFLGLNNIRRKRGPPNKAVSAPTGSSAGAKQVRANVSAKAKKAPPSKAEEGKSQRWS